ncbi:bleomycin resistance protein [Fischerella muscicola CCMEE 5323]|uniref:Bleomycin resistance protein n=1 Tax=Fischerella muscicola CCMEE 5323 TaxID=2019572 RepID=A0A2N6JUI2_FISMU|nr:VOC family protein [Fischerella muscicola]PLZ81355.1 bleomycin resistance protein [Fischerella muscicola CCMEE 5323]
MWLDAIDHIQVTYPPELEDAMLFFYSKVLVLTEINKPEVLKADGGAWYILGNIQIHLSTEKNPDNAASRRHICYLVNDLQEFKQHLQEYGVKIIPDRLPIPGINRFFLRDPAGNRIEIAESVKNVSRV